MMDKIVFTYTSNMWNLLYKHYSVIDLFLLGYLDYSPSISFSPWTYPDPLAQLIAVTLEAFWSNTWHHICCRAVSARGRSCGRVWKSPKRSKDKISTQDPWGIYTFSEKTPHVDSRACVCLRFFFLRKRFGAQGWMPEIEDITVIAKKDGFMKEGSTTAAGGKNQTFPGSLVHSFDGRQPAWVTMGKCWTEGLNHEQYEVWKNSWWSRCISRTAHVRMMRGETAEGLPWWLWSMKCHTVQINKVIFVRFAPQWSSCISKNSPPKWNSWLSCNFHSAKKIIILNLNSICKIYICHNTKSCFRGDVPLLISSYSFLYFINTVWVKISIIGLSYKCVLDTMHEKIGGKWAFWETHVCLEGEAEVIPSSTASQRWKYSTYELQTEDKCGLTSALTYSYFISVKKSDSARESHVDL